MGEIGFLQVKVIKANDLPATDINGNLQQFTSLCFILMVHQILTLLCHLQEKATLYVLLSSVTADLKLTRSTKPSILSGAKPLHCKISGEKTGHMSYSVLYI